MIWLILIVLFLLATIWGGSYLLGLFEVEVSLSLQIILTVTVLLASVAWVLFRRWRAQKRARELEAEILKQSEQQAAMARPDRRAEIIELQKRVQNGIRALQNTKIGKNHGRSALYALPWYAIIGPPGAGKTTALRHSGLVFPFQDSSGGGVRGVGGTRNCDWWFTNEGILLDTAGRYTTDDADREEWLAFLGMLRKYRPGKPINGLLVAVSVSDLFEATEEQLSAMATKLRARVDEIMTRLDMVLPVYVIFTKADLIGGFVDFWGGLAKSDRDQILGATLPLTDEVAREPGEAFSREFARLGEVLHARALKIVGKEPQPDARARIFQFPLEFKSLSKTTQLFVDELFRQNAFQENPMFRGFYFTSGTQEGAPFQRIMGNMARALGIRQAPSLAAQVESKSYFVTDVFRRVVFPDQNLAGRTASEVRRQKLIRAGISAAAVLLGALLVIPGVASMAKNRELISTSESVSDDAAKIDWGGKTSADKKITELNPARTQLLLLDGYEKEGPPIGMRWGMYTGETLHPALTDAYAGHLERGMASPTRQKLERALSTVGMSQSLPSSQYGHAYDSLKLYLMMGQIERLDREWASPRLTKHWGELLRDTSPETLKAMTPHVDYYLELLEEGKIPPWPNEEKLVNKARSVLLRAPQIDRIYDLLVREANEEVAPIRRENIFYGSIGPFVKGRKNVQVAGAYTAEGWEKVRTLLSSQQSRLSGEKWVLGEKDTTADKDVAKQIAALEKLYFDRYQAAWQAFLADLVVERPTDSTTALEELNALSEPEWPYLRLLRTLHENVALPTGNEKDATDTIIDKAKDELKERLGQEKDKPAEREITSVERAFLPLSTFAIPAKEGDASATPLAQYQATVAKLVGLLTDLRDGDTPTDTSGIESEFQSAFRATSALLAGQTGFTRPLLSPLLLRPIMGTWSGVSNDVGSAAGGLWEIAVWEDWNKNLEPKYPFKFTVEDAKLEDFVEFFRPKTGALWSFYDQNLKSSVRKVGDGFIATRRFDSAVSYNSEFLGQCLHRGNKITEAFFPADSDKPQIDFEVNLHSVSKNVSEVSLSIDGVTHTYKNTPEQWLTGRWPAEEGTPGAHVRIQGASGLDEEIIRDGEFGFFRLIKAASKLEEGTAAGAPAGVSTLVATYEFPSERAFLQLDIRTKQGLEVLMPKLLDGYRCPRIITTPTN